MTLNFYIYEGWDLMAAVFGGTSSTSSVFYPHDANGNVSDVISEDTEAMYAHSEYILFGETVVQAGDAQAIVIVWPVAFLSVPMVRPLLHVAFDIGIVMKLIPQIVLQVGVVTGGL
jgi:hypothetical protein